MGIGGGEEGLGRLSTLASPSQEELGKPRLENEYRDSQWVGEAGDPARPCSILPQGPAKPSEGREHRYPGG